jgi:hypothetical protein
MKVAEARDELHKLLVAHDVDPDHLDLRRTWEVIKLFSSLPVDDVDTSNDGDQLLYESRLGKATRRDGGAGSAYPDEPTRFELLFDRQFYLGEADADYQGMNALTITIQFEPVPELAAFASEQVGGCGGPPWQDGYEAAAGWAREVEQQPGFRFAFDNCEPVDGFFSQGPI